MSKLNSKLYNAPLDQQGKEIKVEIIIYKYIFLNEKLN
jgi:hypothetical protein